MNQTLITSLEVIDLAYISSLNEFLIKDEIILTAQDIYIKPILGAAFLSSVIASPHSYSTLISYIKPCLAFYVKYLIYNQQFIETGEYNHALDPSLAPDLIQIGAAVHVSTNLRRDAIGEIVRIANAKRTALISHLNASNYPLYNPSTPFRCSGFILNKS